MGQISSTAMRETNKAIRKQSLQVIAALQVIFAAMKAFLFTTVKMWHNVTRYFVYYCFLYY